jgi:GTP-binding protein
MATKPSTERALRFESAHYLTSVALSGELLRAGLAPLPEVAFVGRSNAGKSTTINVLTAQRQLAFASKTPGRTQMLNFFAIDAIDGAGHAQPAAYLVDLPGYGFAKIDDETRQRWDQLVGGYLRDRRMLRGVVLVIDARHPFKPADEELIAWLTARDDTASLRLHLLLNKADQLSTTEKRRTQALAESRAESLPMPTSVQLFSGLKRQGIDELRETIAELLALARHGAA